MPLEDEARGLDGVEGYRGGDFRNVNSEGNWSKVLRKHDGED